MSYIGRQIFIRSSHVPYCHEIKVLSSICINRNYSFQPPPEYKKLYKKLKYSKVREKKPKKKTLKDDGIPLIVKLITKQNDNDFISNSDLKDIDAEANSFHDLSKDKLESELKKIKQDFQSRILESQLSDEDEITDEDIAEEACYILPKRDECYVESVFLDEDKLSTYKSQSNDRTKELIGTPVPGTGYSDIPCPGCGALLHCEDPTLPGYMKGEQFTIKTRDELRESVCQRCHVINHNNLCLNVTVDEREYSKIISVIKHSNPLLIVMVDLLDMENSIFPNLLHSVGNYKQIVVVGNKVDLIPKDGVDYLKNLENSLVEACKKAGLNDYNNIRHVALISAKTGYGVEELITKLIDIWGIKDDVYLLGSTNTGKSTLFNTLLASDYCKSKVRDYIKRATTSVWSGTTLNLLKFPLMNPEPHRLQKRKERLELARLERNELKRGRKSKDAEYYEKDPILDVTIETTDFRRLDPESKDEMEAIGHEIVSFQGDQSGDILYKESDIDENDGKPSLDEFLEKQFVNVRWLYDTPGVIKSEQIVNLLKDEEVLTITPKKRLIPRVYILDPGQVMFISGLGRLDYLQGQNTIYITVFTDLSIPVYTKNLYTAEKFYNRQIHYSTLKVPVNKGEHLPTLDGIIFNIIGEGTRYSTADIQLSSLGWISVAIQRGEEIKIKAYTPGGLGCHVRKPSLLPNYKAFKGERIKATNKYQLRQ